MRRQLNIIEHGPRRLWSRPWRVLCRCGLGAWPCHVMRMRAAQTEMLAAVDAHPRWNAPTAAYRPGSLMTRGQEFRAGPLRGPR